MKAENIVRNYWKHHNFNIGKSTWVSEFLKSIRDA